MKLASCQFHTRVLLQSIMMCIGCFLHISVILAWQLTEVDSSPVLNFAFPCGLCGFHVYKELWNPWWNEKPNIIFEEDNPHNCCAVLVREIPEINWPMFQNLQKLLN